MHLLRVVTADAERWATKMELEPQSGSEPVAGEVVLGGPVRGGEVVELL